MILKEIHINGFKNIAEASLCFSPKVNALLGNNGMGKSNLLDAIYFLSFCKSFSGMTDAQIIRRGDDFAMVRATYLRHGIDEQLSLGITPGRRKSLQKLCEDGRISGVAKFSRMWLIPKDAPKPADGRIKGRKEGDSK